ncbi:uroporphyrinogen-III C-methyltransferase [Edwardsiella piscicida]|uniref:siroheme synthase CysG n=1 Tax=Edwardsiella piscicida TaxID=1263550 RepID=UPI0002C10A6F|nr:siroheme synthase CysG [Edwardsiella piscicida]AGH75225.1 siroheme synthase [Edwardsiella piscicida C07-087]AOP44429.1 siroheme synthase CysG [Edwardsiella piscicida]EKS7768312.1 uroporphyrinogen-III C-methyltransferase [Edwardsiella piscicida]EKS7781574.1 uroporphyrinogen-III C-methyltransferase [Edwardsiella piscicida]EKS7784906.1 uroporphyrinogen-III C-methyltransferase [Edwardsiella piscicida]
MDYFPIFCQLRTKPCLLVGGGEVAERKARLLMEAGAILTVNAGRFTPQFEQWQRDGQLTLIAGDFDPALLTGKWLAIAATDDSRVNQQVLAQAEARCLFCNVVDAAQQTGFIMPSIVDRSPLMVAVSSGGSAPVLARILREKLEALLPQHLGQLAHLAGHLRQRVKAHFPTLSLRRRFWERLFAQDRLAQSLANGDTAQTQQQVDALFSAAPADRGEVTLVGAGPGDAGLLTLKGLQQIQRADVIIYDRLVSDEVMSLVRRDATRIFVGKRAGHHCVPQEEINQTLLDHAREGKRVVRLKGGDPFIFGRGGEELEALAAAGIAFSVVPGITAASGCSAYSGIPLTHRDHAQSVRLVTGHTRQDGQLDWSCLAAAGQTLVFYMGLSQAATIQQRLLQHGMLPDTPVALVENGTTVRQRVVSGTLTQLETLATRVTSPSLIIVGDVVTLRPRLNWFRSEETSA